MYFVSVRFNVTAAVFHLERRGTRPRPVQEFRIPLLAVVQILDGDRTITTRRKPSELVGAVLIGACDQDAPGPLTPQSRIVAEQRPLWPVLVLLAVLR